MSNLLLIRSLEHLIEGSTAYSTRTKNRRWVKVYELESRRIKPDSCILRQLLAIMRYIYFLQFQYCLSSIRRRVLAGYWESSIKIATAIALVILESSGYITELLSKEEIDSIIQNIRNNTKYVLDTDKRCAPYFTRVKYNAASQALEFEFRQSKKSTAAITSLKDSI